MPVSVNLGDSNNIFHRILTAADHLSIPKIEAGTTRMQYHRLIDGSLVFVSGISFFRLTC